MFYHNINPPRLWTICCSVIGAFSRVDRFNLHTTSGKITKDWVTDNDTQMALKKVHCYVGRYYAVVISFELNYDPSDLALHNSGLLCGTGAIVRAYLLNKVRLRLSCGFFPVRYIVHLQIVHSFAISWTCFSVFDCAVSVRLPANTHTYISFQI